MLAQETGQRPSMPILHLPVIVSESKSDDEKGKRKRRRRNSPQDVLAPFIDDPELAIDERTFFAQTTQSLTFHLGKWSC
ncbi:hypothetical protein AX14_011086 [Amanita brunnescens Koide BX004]|nr:hypothetical protein AX14_011086 [Amanita brunnescens Koide BX004]